MKFDFTSEIGRSRIAWSGIGFFALAFLLVPSVALAENVVIPQGVTGTLILTFKETNGAACERVRCYQARRPVNCLPEVDGHITESVPRVLDFNPQVRGGETFEFYIQTNKLFIPDVTPATYSSDPKQNATIDPGLLDHIQQPQQQSNNVWLLRWEDKKSSDPGFDKDFDDLVVTVQVLPARCDNVTIPCPGINDVTSNHNATRVAPVLERRSRPHRAGDRSVYENQPELPSAEGDNVVHRVFRG